MKAVVIGGSGHVGTYLVPDLVEAGYEVVSVSRSKREPYQPHLAWNSVERITIDRKVAEEAGDFGKQIADLKPDVIVDMICFTPDSARQLVDAVKGKVSHFLHAGTVWTHGQSRVVQTTEATAKMPFGDYGINKAAIEAYLLKEAKVNGFPATIFQPGHIVGPGWRIVNPQGNFNPEIFQALQKGETVTIPHFGMETVHHIHASDLVLIVMKSLEHWSAAVGESFHAVSDAAVTLCGYGESMAAWFGQEANLEFLPWVEWEAGVSEADSRATREHIGRSPNCSIEKAKRLIDWHPRYSSLQACQESVTWMMGNALAI
jgi:nucleoside-diphosphate-sugar epimerase